MKKVESFCTACEWKGDGTGMAACPICGQPITTLDIDEGISGGEAEEYPAGVLKKEAEADEF